MSVRNFLQLVVVFAVLNFLAFFIVALYLGGSAGNGHILDGQYFLGDHGRYVGVSKAVYDYSQAHGYSLFLTHPLGVLAAVLLKTNGGGTST